MAHRCISSKINARRPAASSACSNATAKEGHINYDISDVLVEAIINLPVVGVERRRDGGG
jgi:hypothetical protein